MSINNHILIINNSKFLLLYIFFFGISFSFCSIPNTILYASTKLNNGNILLMTNKGILIYDEFLTKLIKKTEANFSSNTNVNFIYQLLEKDECYIIISSNTYNYFLDLTGQYISNTSFTTSFKISSYHSKIPYGLTSNIYYFCYVYNNIQQINLLQYYYNANSNIFRNNNSRSYNFSDLCPNDHNYVSCQYIIYKNRKSLICFFTNHLTGHYINMKIYDIYYNFNELDSYSFGNSGYEINTFKNHLKNEQKVLLITRSLYWAGFDILDNTYTMKKAHYQKEMNAT